MYYNRLHITVLHIIIIVTAVIVSFYIQGGSKSKEWSLVCNPEKLDYAFLYNELDLLVRQLFLQLVEAH